MMVAYANSDIPSYRDMLNGTRPKMPAAVSRLGISSLARC